MPPRPDPRKVRLLATEDHGDYTVERFEFHNGVDMVVPGVILIPKNRQGRVPAIIGLHGHGSLKSNRKEVAATKQDSTQLIGPTLAKKGYVVAAIGGYFHGGASAKAPGGDRDSKDAQEATLFKLCLWQGRTLWGMMMRDQPCLIDYL